MKIKHIHAREILDSRGNPTVEVEVHTKLGKFIGTSPSGASTGEAEAVELRDGGKRYLGKGVRKAVRFVNGKIRLELVGKSCVRQATLDDLLCKIDGSLDKSRIGANAIVACSIAIARAGAASKKLPLYIYLNTLYSQILGHRISIRMPQGYYNVLNGGVHTANKLAFQEFMIVPKARSFREQLRISSEIYHTLQTQLIKRFKGRVIALGDEGGFAPPIIRAEEALTLLSKAVTISGYAGKVSFAIDVAASEFYVERKGRGKKSGEYHAHKIFSPTQLLIYYLKLFEKYPLVSIEDPFDENSLSDFSLLLTKTKGKLQIVADDLTCTNPERVRVAVQDKAANCLLLKVNQIGTVTEALHAAAIAQRAGWKIMVSHRSGETTDDFIADLAVGIGSGQLKSGAPARGERVAKYNRLLRIEEELKRK